MQAFASTYCDIIIHRAYANSCVRLCKIAVSQESSAIPSRCDWSLYAIDAGSLSRRFVAEFATTGRRNEMWRILRSRYASESAISDLADEIAITWTHRHGVCVGREVRRRRYIWQLLRRRRVARLFTVHRLTPWVRGEKGRERKKQGEGDLFPRTI